MKPERTSVSPRPKLIKRSAVTVSLVSVFLGTAALAAVDAQGPTGKWRTIDDDSGKPRAIVEIKQTDGELQGKIVKLLNQPKDDKNPVCDECEGPRHGKPVLGMTILWGLEKDGNEWTDGKILDPESGDVYDAAIKLGEGGETLKVRGYLGISLLGRTQTWQRVSAPADSNQPATDKPA